MKEKIVKLLASIPDWENGYSFENRNVIVNGLNDPFDGNLVQFDRIYSCDPNQFLSIQQQNEYNDESEYDPFFIIGQTTSDALIAFDQQGRVVILDFDCTYPASEDKVSPVYSTNLDVDNFKEIIVGSLDNDHVYNNIPMINKRLDSILNMKFTE